MRQLPASCSGGSFRAGIFPARQAQDGTFPMPAHGTSRPFRPWQLAGLLACGSSGFDPLPGLRQWYWIAPSPHYSRGVGQVTNFAHGKVRPVPFSSRSPDHDFDPDFDREPNAIRFLSELRRVRQSECDKYPFIRDFSARSPANRPHQGIAQAARQFHQVPHERDQCDCHPLNARPTA